MASPLEQFKITPLAELEVAGIDASFTNSALFMVLATVLASGFLMFAMRKRELVPGRLQNMAEMLYGLVASMLNDAAGPEARRYFPYVFTVFTFILFANMLGMIPYGFTTTSHIAVTFVLAGISFLLVILIGIFRHGFKFLKLFVPEGVPLPLLILLTPIEIISFLIRPITLSVRLFGNMLAGHTMLKVFAGFVVSLGSIGAVGMIGAILPIAFMVFFTGLEFLVAYLQAYIFTILLCIYLSDAIHLHEH